MNESGSSSPASPDTKNDRREIANLNNIIKKENSRIRREGWLTKQGKTLRNWKRRWVVLFDAGPSSYLRYYANERKKESLGKIDLEGRSVVEDTSSKKPYCFSIIPPSKDDRVFHLYADTEDEFKSWLGVLKNLDNQEPQKSHSQRGRITSMEERKNEKIEEKPPPLPEVVTLDQLEAAATQLLEDHTKRSTHITHWALHLKDQEFLSLFNESSCLENLLSSLFKTFNLNIPIIDEDDKKAAFTETETQEITNLLFIFTCALAEEITASSLLKAVKALTTSGLPLQEYTSVFIESYKKLPTSLLDLEKKHGANINDLNQKTQNKEQLDSQSSVDLSEILELLKSGSNLVKSTDLVISTLEKELQMKQAIHGHRLQNKEQILKFFVKDIELYNQEVKKNY